MTENFDNIQIPFKFLNRRSKFIHSDSELDNFIRITILEWAEKDFTCPNAIQKYVYQTIEPHSMKLYFSQCYNNIHAMRTHIDTIQNVNSHIWALLSCRPAVTFLDIYKMIEALCGNNLRVLGPITKIPIIKSQIFGNMDINYSTPDIRLSDLICDCSDFLTEKIKTDKRNDEISIVNAQSEKQFLHFLLKKYHINDFNLLGVRIVNFKALRDAAYAAKGDSFHKLISSDKLNKLLKSDVKVALKNIRERLAATKMFQINNKSLEDLTKFANMPFQDAIKRFFQPFLDEEKQIFAKHNINATDRDEIEDSLAVIRKIIPYLVKNKMFGRLFHLAVITGTIDKLKPQIKLGIDLNDDDNDARWQDLIKLAPGEWKSKIFCPLLNEINSYLQISLNHTAATDGQGNNQYIIDQISVMSGKIIEKCRAIAYLFMENRFKSLLKPSMPSITNYKAKCLSNLANCCQMIIETFSSIDHSTDERTREKLHLDLLPQAYHLLILILSRSKLMKFQSLKQTPNCDINEQIIDCVFQVKLIDYLKMNDNYKSITNNQLTLESIDKIEKSILDVLDKSCWPLDCSFMTFLSNHNHLINRSISELANQYHVKGGDDQMDVMMGDMADMTDQGGNQGENNQCNCIAVHQQHIIDLIKQLPMSISNDQFINHILPTFYGIQLTDCNKKSMTDLFSDHGNHHQHHHHHHHRHNDLLEDNLPAAIDLRFNNLSINISNYLMKQIDIMNPDHVMRLIADVPLLGNVTIAMKWNEIYRHFWGDVCQFINNHSQLAASFNIRLLRSEIGIVRLCVTVDIDQIKTDIQSMIIQCQSSSQPQPQPQPSFSNLANTVIGQCVSILIKANESSKLDLSQIIECLAVQMSSSANQCSSDLFVQFATIAINSSPIEIFPILITNFLYPLCRRTFSPNDINEVLKSLLNAIDRSFWTLLSIYLSPDHPVTILMRVIRDDIYMASNTESQSNQQSITNQKSHIVKINDNCANRNLIGQPMKTIIDNDQCDLVIDLQCSTATNNDNDDDDLSINQEQHHQQQQNIVEDIRINEFGVGFNIDAAAGGGHGDGDHIGSKIVNNFNKKMARLVEHLSSDLYANTSHFVLELLQNADDNRYQSHVRPTLELIWKPTTSSGLTLMVINNEMGFTELDLRSLCDIGASTKSQYRSHKIGRKGIGFKSVFMVTDSPQIHSNGFHVEFNRYLTDGSNNKLPNNALIPTWCAQSTDYVINNSNQSQTIIVLPIIPSLTHQIRQQVTLQLKPYLLLFLRNLLRISVSHISDDGLTCSERFIELATDECHGNRKVVMTETGEKHCWFICSRKLPIIDLHLQEISPTGLAFTEISIAIRIDDNDEYQDLPAFAFLPIRSYGLRFIVNADFVIPASREDIVNESPWNKWLIDQLADVFTDSLHDYIYIDSNISHGNIIKLIEAIPLPGEVPGDSSFHILVPKLRANLTNLPWLPDRYNNMHSPSQLIIESIDDTSDLTDELCNRLKLTLLHPHISKCSSERVSRVLSWLGCQSLSLSHLSKLLTTLKSDDFHNKPLIKSIIIAIHNGLERDSSIVINKRIIMQLSSLPIWPVMGSGAEGVEGVEGAEQLISINQSDVPVFLPPSHWISSILSSSSSSSSTDSFSCLRRLISPLFLSSYESIGNNKHINIARSILLRLGVHELTSSSMLAHAITPVLSNQNHSPSRQWLITAARFLVDQCHPSQYRESILPRLSFATITHNCDESSSSISTVSSYDQLFQIHLPISMTTDNDFISLLNNNIDYITIDDQYLDGVTDFKPWRDFFLIAGVCETFYCHVNDKDEKTFPQITQLLQINNKSINIDLLRYIDKNWNHFPNLRSICLLSNLISNPSIPVCTSTSCLNQPDQLLDISSPLRFPSESLSLSSSDPNKVLFPDSLLIYFPICPVVFSNNAFPQQLGMITNIGVDQIMSLLNKIFITKSIHLTSKQAIDLYDWMQHNLSRVSLMNIFSTLKQQLNGSILVAIPDGDDHDRCELVLDQYCYWTLPLSGVSNKHVFIQDQQVHHDLIKLLNPIITHNDLAPCRSLVKLFPELEDLFVNIMQIRQFPSNRDIWDTLNGLLNLLDIDRINNLNHAEIELITDVYNVIQYLDHYYHGQYRSDVLNMPMIPCFHGGYRSFIDNTKEFRIYSWKSLETVRVFQKYLDDKAPIDFVAINCFPNVKKKDSYNNYYHSNTQHNHINRWSAPQFLMFYFNLPVLEDEMCFHINNRHSFQPCRDIKSMVAHLEVIVSQWFQRNVSRDGVAHCMNMLSSITNFCIGHEPISISVSLRNQPNLAYEYVENVYIGARHDHHGDSFEILVANIDGELIGMNILDNVMNGLIAWILQGDSFLHLRERFRKFYKSLFDLIESSDRSQVSIFIRSHNLRINPFSIDYIYDKFSSHSVDNTVDNNNIDDNDNLSPQSLSDVLSLTPNRLNDLADVADSPAGKSDCLDRNILKRKMMFVTTECGVLSKQIRLDDVDEPQENASSPFNGSLFIPIDTQAKSPEFIQNNSKSAPNIISKFTKMTSSGRSSPLSTKIIDQFSNQKFTRLSTSGASFENISQISGRIGEQLAFEKLSMSQCLGVWEITRVDWVNQDEESRLPYDFKLSARRSDSGISEIIYLEVKATTQPNKLQFDLSPQEVTAAWSFKENYHLLIVFHSGNFPDANSKFVHIPDLLGQLQENQCKLLLDVGDLLDQ